MTHGEEGQSEAAPEEQRELDGQTEPVVDLEGQVRAWNASFVVVVVSASSNRRSCEVTSRKG